jgi:2-polyprenyl-3-methyl-5-hydroxy-6-metoxy-1,4-benzoquinol methylase
VEEVVEQHWRDVYGRKDSTEVSWYQEVPARSLRWIEEVCPSRESRIIDVGAGASTLVDNLLVAGYRHVTALDIAAPALDLVKKRLGGRGEEVEWVVIDLLEYAPATTFDLWHDRAVLHFLRRGDEQVRYAKALERSVRPDGLAIIATFAVGGPTRCSGQETVQYDADRIQGLLPSCHLLREEEEIHHTPSGVDQLFTYFLLRRLD